MAEPARRIVDASPLILLGKVAQLELLRAGVAEVIVPRAVVDEVGAAGSRDPMAQAVQRTAWLTVVPAPRIPPEVLVWDLGAGESAVLSLALLTPDCEVVLDDRDARRCAQSLNIDLRGTVGLVLLAKRLGVIPLARPVVEQVRRAGLYLTDDVVEQALALVGE